jgi:hypothetical protein
LQEKSKNKMLHNNNYREIIMNITSPPLSTDGSTKTSDIVLIITTIMTGLFSLADLLVNTYIGYKKRHFTSSCCEGFCSCAYDSESQEDAPQVKHLSDEPVKK